MSVRYAEEFTALECGAVNRHPVIARLSLAIVSLAPIGSVDRRTDYDHYLVHRVDHVNAMN